MKLKVLASGSSGNCYILTTDSGKHLILDAGIPIKDIKKGLDFDIANVQAAICTHKHLDHFKSVKDLQKMGIIVWQPYLDTANKRMQTSIGDFTIESFPVPHNGTENRGFIIYVDKTVILYCTDFEYVPYDLSRKKINVMLIELNYQKDRIDGNDHLAHIVLGHSEEQTTIGVITNNMKHLRKVILCHMSKSGGLDRELAMKHIREVVPEYIEVEWAKANTTCDISEIPF